MHCAAAGYETEAKAVDARRDLRRHYYLNAVVVYCQDCDAYHTEVELRGKDALKRWQRWKVVLTLLAQGLSARMIGEELGVSRRAIEKNIISLHEHFYALNTTHLIAIALSLRLVDPNQCVPRIGEHRGPAANLQRRTNRSEVKRSLLESPRSGRKAAG